MTESIGAPSPTNPQSQQALYLLGFSPSGTVRNHSDVSPTTSLDYATAAMLRHLGIERLDLANLSAWYKMIDRCDFEGDQGEKNLADIQWLTPRVIAHERVVAAISQQLPFYPSRFGTLFSSQSSLHSFATSVQAPLEGFFHRVAGKLEWGIKFYGDAMLAAEILAKRDGIVQNGKPAGGANYLRLRQMQRERNASTQLLLTQSLEQARTQLQSRYQDIVSRPLIASSVEAKREELIGNLAVLLSDHDSQTIVRWGQDWNECQLSRTGLRVEITGPWPAYSFCPSLSPIPNKEAA